MKQRSEFAYVQARLQAQHGRRPDAAAWAAVEASRSALHFVERARSGPLAAWVEGLHPREGACAVERQLHARWQRRVDEVARWLPPRWRAAVRNFGSLVVLPLDRSADAVPQDAATVLARWQARWRRSVPSGEADPALLLRIAALLLPALRGDAAGRHGHGDAELAAARRLLRRHAGTPVAVFAHLAALALDFERLRGNVVQRCVLDRDEAGDGAAVSRGA